MNFNLRWCYRAAAVAAAALLSESLAHASELNWDIREAGTNAPLGEGSGVPFGYGDFIGAYPAGQPFNGNVFNYDDAERPTPDVRVEYRWVTVKDSANNGKPYGVIRYKGYGDLTSVLTASQSDSFVEVRLIPAERAAISLHSFDIAVKGQPGPFLPGQSVKVFRGSATEGQLAWVPNGTQGDDITLPQTNQAHDHYEPNITGKSGQIISIVFGPSPQVGIGNINFTQSPAATLVKESDYLGPVTRSDTFIEAESFQVPAHWRVANYKQWDITEDATGGKYLYVMQGEGQGTAQASAPQAGDYRLWVRYIDHPQNVRVPFRIIVSQGDKTIGEKVFDEALIPPKTPYRYPTYNNWMWQPLDLKLAAGAYQIAIQPVKGSGIAGIDCFVVTRGTDYVPDAEHFHKPLFARVTLDQIEPQKPSLIYFGTTYLGRRALSERQFLDGMPNPINMVDALKPGMRSRWVNINPATWKSGETWLQVTLTDGAPWAMPKSSKWTLELSRTPSDEGLIKRWTREGPGGGMVLRLDFDDPTKIASSLELSAENRRIAEGLKPAGKHPEKFPTVTGMLCDPTITPQAVIENDLAAIRALGYNGTQDTHLDPGFLQVNGMKYEVVTVGPARDTKFWVRDAQWLKNNFAESFAPRYADKRVQIPFVRMSDEIGNFWATTELAKTPEVKTWFHEYLKELKVMPRDLLGDATPADAEAAWAAINLTEDGKNSPRLFYYTKRFRSHMVCDYYRWATSQISAQYPGALTSINTTCDLTSNRNMLERDIDWFEMYRTNAWTYGFFEDANNLTPSDQLVGFIFDHMRAATRLNNQTMGTFVIMNRPGPDLAKKAFTEVGRGLKMLDFYMYGPAHAPFADGRSDKHEQYPALAAFNYALGAVEGEILESKPVPSQVAILYSQSSDIWDLYHRKRLAGAEAQGIYLLMRHLGWSFDVLSEDDVLAGAATPYKLIVVTGANLKTGVAEKLAAWTNAGGTLYIGPGAATSDEFDRPLPAEFTNKFPRATLNFVAAPGSDSSLPTQKTLREVKSGDETLSVISASQELETGNGQVLATYADNNTPAVVSYPQGKGRILSVGFPIGSEYPRQGLKSMYEVGEKSKVPPYSRWSFSPVEYSAAPREAIRDWLALTGIEPPVQVSEPLVDASLLEYPKGRILVLSNWSRGPCDVTVRIKLNKAIAAPRNAAGELQNVHMTLREVSFTTHLDYGAFILLPNAPQ